MECFQDLLSILEKEIEFSSMSQTMHNITCLSIGMHQLCNHKSCMHYLTLSKAAGLPFEYRHGLKQYRNGWADGPAYITQCPIKTGNSYTYDFNVTGQRGTLWWHAHILWLRATVYGAIVIMPKEGTSFPFPQPYQETNIILGR